MAVGQTDAMPRPTTMVSVYAAVSVLYVGAAAASLTVVTTATKPLLMPALAAFLISASPRPFTRMVRIVLGALAFSWLGDVLLEVSRLADSDDLFLAGLGGFLVAQVLYVVAFAPVVRSSSPPRPPLWALVYVLYAAGLVAFLAPDLGEFLLPVAVYAAAICTMGIVASGVNAFRARRRPVRGLRHPHRRRPFHRPGRDRRQLAARAGDGHISAGAGADRRRRCRSAAGHLAHVA